MVLPSPAPAFSVREAQVRAQNTLTSSTSLRARLTTQGGLAILDFFSFVSATPPYLASPAPAPVSAFAESTGASRGGGHLYPRFLCGKHRCGQEAMGAT